MAIIVKDVRGFLLILWQSRGKYLLEIPSKRRNPISADIFSRLKYMERRDGGFKII